MATYKIEGDVYRVQRRPAHTQIVINDGYSGLRVIDAWTGALISRILFTRGYDPSGIVDGWCFRSDGALAMVFNQESRTASWLPLEPGGPSHDLSLPFAQPGDLRYVWEGDSFWLVNGKSYGFFRLAWRDGKPFFEEARSFDAKIANPRWRAAVDSLPMYDANVLRVESDQQQMLFHDFTEGAHSVGVASWRDEEPILWQAPASGEIPLLAFHPDNGRRMFVMREFEVRSLDRRGETADTYPAPEGSQFVGLDTIPTDGAKPPALVVVSSPLSDPGRSAAALYPLGNAQE